MTGALAGADEAAALFQALPEAARYELADTPGRIGRDVLAAQEVLAPRRSGELASELDIALLTQQLRVQIGLIGPTREGFIGRILEFGRRDQYVVSHPISAVNRSVWLARIKAGKASSRRRPADLVAAKVKHIGAITPHPFVHIPDAELDAIVDSRIANFWDRSLDQAGA